MSQPTLRLFSPSVTSVLSPAQRMIPPNSLLPARWISVHIPSADPFSPYPAESPLRLPRWSTLYVPFEDEDTYLAGFNLGSPVLFHLPICLITIPSHGRLRHLSHLGINRHPQHDPVRYKLHCDYREGPQLTSSTGASSVVPREDNGAFGGQIEGTCIQEGSFELVTRGLFVSS